MDKTAKLMHNFEAGNAKSMAEVQEGCYKGQNFAARLLTDNPGPEPIMVNKSDLEKISLAFCDAIEYLSFLDKALKQVQEAAMNVHKTLNKVD